MNIKISVEMAQEVIPGLGRKALTPSKRWKAFVALVRVSENSYLDEGSVSRELCRVVARSLLATRYNNIGLVNPVVESQLEVVTDGPFKPAWAL